MIANTADNKILRLKSSVALVIRENVLEFFKTNVREQILIEVENSKILDIVKKFDGKKTIYEISNEYGYISKSELIELACFLNESKVLIECDKAYESNFFEKNVRILNLLEDYFLKTSEVIEAVNKLNSTTVAIVGLGAVGTWIAEALTRTGVRNYIFIDPDKVDISNLHRQNLFFESDVGRYKIDCIEEYLNQISDVSVKKFYENLDIDFFEKYNDRFDLIINCADFPNVDTTTNIIGKECMKRGTPHIIGGGYNLHLTLIGQTVIPGKTACVRCFDLTLRKINNSDLEGVKKLARQSRKIGSFGPLCSFSASITANEAIKVIIGAIDEVINKNKRIEFITSDLDFKSFDIPMNEKCDWCGINGVFKVGKENE